MKKALTFFVILFNIIINAQIKNIYVGKVDSVVIRNYSYHDKETSTIFDTDENTTSKLLNSKKITAKQVENLNELLKFRKSYLSSRALLSHFNKKIEYYLDGIKIQDITISMVTKNITIYKNDKCIYEGKMSPFLEKGLKNIEK